MSFELAYIPVSSLVPNENNAQEMNEATFALLVESMKHSRGCIEALTVVDLQDGTYRIIGGEHRWRAAQKIGLSLLPALIVPADEWDVDWQDIYTVRLNVLKGALDKDKFLKVYSRLSARYGKDVLQEQLGFTDRVAFNRLVGDMSKSLKDMGVAKEVREEFESKASKAKTAADLGSILQELMARYGHTLEAGFMVFTYGRQEHVYVPLSSQMRKSLDKILAYCYSKNVTVSDLFSTVLGDVMEYLTAIDELPEKGLSAVAVRSSAVAEDGEGDVDF